MSNEKKHSKQFSHDIQNEIDYIQSLLLESENKNKILSQLFQKKIPIENISKKKTNIFEEVELRLENLTEQIFRLQMQQFSESICRVQKHKKKNIFKISFDPELNIPTITLNEKDYKQLLSYRDPFHCSNITESFIADESSTFHNNSKNKKKETIKTNFKYYVGKFVLPSYNFCHHCKLLKQSEYLIKCQMCNPKQKIQNKPEPQVKVMFANQGIILKKDKIYLLEHYDGNIRELIDEYFSYKKNNTYFCEKYYCRSCLKLSYDISLDSKTEKTFICPGCKDHCSCSRCFRNDQLIKIIACYITLNGDINKLYDFLKEKNSIMEILINHLTLSKFVIFDMSDKAGEKIKNNNIINFDNLMSYKKILEDYQNYFGACFEKYKKEKILSHIEKEMIFEECEKNGLLNKKRINPENKKVKKNKKTKKNTSKCKKIK